MKTTTLNWATKSVVLAACLLGVGCGGTEVERVSGQMLVGEKPLKDASICFWPKTDLNLGMLICFRTTEDGQFDIVPAAERGEGRAGAYKIVVQEADKMLFDIRLPRFNAVYKSADTTPLEQEIDRGTTELAPISIELNPQEVREHEQKLYRLFQKMGPTGMKSIQQPKAVDAE